MKKIKILSAILVIAVISMGCSQAINYSGESVKLESNSRAVTINKPFPQNSTLAGLTKPSISQSQMASDIKAKYDKWKQEYGHHYTFTGGRVDGDGEGYVIKGEASGGTWNWPTSAKTISTSEAHGYGMIIFALMAGYDPEAKVLFDKMYKTKVNFPSLYSPNLTSWVFPLEEVDDQGVTHPANLKLQNQPCAADGDMDMAYALLLADKQWGDGPEGYSISYKQAAIDMINDLGELAILTDAGKHFPRLGTSDSKYGPFYPERATRPSDFMIGHMDIFEKLATDADAKKNWGDVKNTTIEIVDYVQATYANNTGLMPEFLASKNADFNSNISTFNGISDENGGAFDNAFYSNACRFPWRYSMGYAQTQNSNVKAVMDNFNSWLVTKHNKNGSYDPTKTRAGYLLDGSFDNRHDVYTDTGVKAGFMAALAAGTDGESLKTAWNDNLYFPTEDEWSTYYYQNSINLLVMLYVSGNWWDPMGDTTVDLAPTKPTNLVATARDVIGTTEAKIDLTWTPSTDDNGPVTYEIRQAMNPGTRLVRVQEITSNGSATTGSWANDVTVELYVVAIDNAGQKTYSDKISVTTPPFVNDIPTKPTNLSVTGVTETSATVKWTSSEDVGLMGHKILISDGAMVYHHAHKPCEYTFTGLTKNTEYTVSIMGGDNWNVDGPAASITFKTSGGGNPVQVPSDPAASAKPSSFSLTKDNWNGNSTYKIIANMWYGQNATLVKLYENGALVDTKNPNFATPSAQKIEFSFSGKAKGTYVYKMEAINQHGTTTTSNFTYTVTQ